MSEYIGEIRVIDIDEREGYTLYSVYRSGTGGQSYSMRDRLDGTFGIRNMVSGHTINPKGRLGKALVEATKDLNSPPW